MRGFPDTDPIAAIRPASYPAGVDVRPARAF
jgi:hypothetical protein